MITIKETEKAYIAGFIDGEGCINIYKREPKRRGRKSYEYALNMLIANTRLEPLKFIMSSYGGHIQKYIDNRGSNRAICYHLCLSPRSSQNLLLSIYPYLMIKKPHADIAFKLCELRKRYPRKVIMKRSNCGKKVPNCLPNSLEYTRAQEKCYQKLRELNKKGKK